MAAAQNQHPYQRIWRIQPKRSPTQPQKRLPKTVTANWMPQIVIHWLMVNQPCP